MINYNRKLFRDAGLDYPKAGWTWDNFREIAKKLTVRDAAGNVTQFGYEVSIHIVEEAFGSFEIGYAASVSVIMTFVILIITSIQLVASRRWVRY
ncbi:MAG: extracellular solute-binding protein, partial [Deltaproteobacteria bacterium]|nr:extracellular solute-binding protein [Deltaproteobacteria bacterium]